MAPPFAFFARPRPADAALVPRAAVVALVFFCGLVARARLLDFRCSVTSIRIVLSPYLHFWSAGGFTGLRLPRLRVRRLRPKQRDGHSFSFLLLDYVPTGPHPRSGSTSGPAFRGRCNRPP